MLPSEIRRPDVGLADAADAVATLFGLAESDVSELPSERDRNFLITTPDGTRRVLKFSNAAVTASHLDLENEVMRRCPVGLTMPRPLPAEDGSELTRRGEHYMRLMTWVPGVPLAEQRPLDAALMESVGGALGRLTAALDDLHHPAAPTDFAWDLRNAPGVVAEGLQSITDELRRRLVQAVLGRHEEIAVTLDTVRRSIIHGDANDHNVLVDGSSGIGLIDLGDIVESATVAEVAVAAAYGILDEPEPAPLIAAIIGGYHREFPLTTEEVDLVLPLVETRLATSVTLAAARRHLAQQNPYLTVSEASAWTCLERLAALDRNRLVGMVRAACGL